MTEMHSQFFLRGEFSALSSFAPDKKSGWKTFFFWRKSGQAQSGEPPRVTACQNNVTLGNSMEASLLTGSSCKKPGRKTASAPVVLSRGPEGIEPKARSAT